MGPTLKEFGFSVSLGLFTNFFKIGPENQWLDI